MLRLAVVAALVGAFGASAGAQHAGVEFQSSNSVAGDSISLTVRPLGTTPPLLAHVFGRVMLVCLLPELRAAVKKRR